MLDFFKKKKEDKKEMSTLEQVRKAYENLSDEERKAFHQSIADRVHESVGEQEAAEGDKDSQTAADREHEALGAEHADERKEGDESKDAAMDSKAEIKEEKTEMSDFSKISERIDSISKIVDGLMKSHEKMLEKLESGDFGSKSIKQDDSREPKMGAMEALYRKKAGY